MRTLHLDHSGLPGGGQLGLARYARGPSTHDRHFHFFEGGPVTDDLVSRGLPVTTSCIPGVSLRQVFVHRHAIRAELEAIAPDLIVANSLRSAVAAAFAEPRVPLVYYARQDMSVESMGRAKRALVHQRVLGRFDGLIANSTWTLQTIPLTLRRQLPHGIAYPLCGVGTEIAPREADGPPIPPEGRRELPRLLWLGRLAPWKGLDIVFQALTTLARAGLRFHLTVAGAAIHEGHKYASSIRSKASKLPVGSTFLGHVDAIDRLFMEHDILIHSSIRPEPFGQVVIQGMAAGLAVVATNAGGPAEIIQEGRDGLLVEPGDVAGLALVLAGLASHPQRVQELGASARRSALDRFSDLHLGRQFEEVLDDVFQQSLMGRRSKIREHRSSRIR